MKSYSPNAEERAFLFQEAQDLEPLIKDIGPISVTVEEAPAKTKQKQSIYRVTFLVAPESMGMRVQATHRNIYEATMAAKEETQRQLNALVNALPREASKPVKIPPEFLH